MSERDEVTDRDRTEGAALQMLERRWQDEGEAYSLPLFLARVRAAGYAAGLEAGSASERAALEQAEARAERLEVQLAGCAVAAMGHTSAAAPGDYGWSASYGAVRSLRARAERMRAMLLDRSRNSYDGAYCSWCGAFMAPWGADAEDHRAGCEYAALTEGSGES